VYKVLIVDDEVLVRVGLKTTIDWEDIGFTVVAEASNGEQGYEQYKKFLPDVIITDIKMPKKDGLWLVEKVRKENPHIKILVLTCYDDFAYARKALKFDVDDYILKSEVEDEELISVMQSVKKKIEDNSAIRQFKDKNLINRNDIKRSIFNDTVKSNFILDDKLLERFNTIEFPTENTELAFVGISINDYKKVHSEKSSLKQINQAVLNIIFDLLTERSIEYIYAYQSKKNRFCLSSQHLSENEVKRIFTSASNAVKQYFDMSLSVVYTEVFDKLNEAGTIYSRFIDKEQIMFYKNESAFFIANIDDISFSEANVISLRKQQNRKFIEAIGQENLVRANLLVREVESIFDLNEFNPKTVKIFYCNLIGDIFNSYGTSFENSRSVSKYEYYYGQIENADYLQNIVKMLLVFTEKAINEIHNMRYNNPKTIINQAINFIHHHYEEKISLEDVAQNLNLSKHYLCSAFKKVTGENMSLFINKLRIEKAKSLLLESNGSIKEIFEEVGYSNQQYFSKVFKKITGITVMEYKENKVHKK
jgi:two-component system response regulator YesN